MGKSKALVDIEKERARQDQMWGEQNHNPSDWLAILMEEVGEAAKIIVERRFDHANTDDDYEDLRDELVQTAAVAVAMIECLDRGKWEW